MNSNPISSVKEVVHKLENYCAYQERCHVEVLEKLRSFTLSENERNQVVVYLIEHNFLNEERFASIFTISKFHQKKWGKIRIKNELKARKISDYLITKSLREIPSEEYYETFTALSQKYWEIITETNLLKKRKKFCDYILRKGWESDLVYEKVKELETS